MLKCAKAKWIHFLCRNSELLRYNLLRAEIWILSNCTFYTLPLVFRSEFYRFLFFYTNRLRLKSLCKLNFWLLRNNPRLISSLDIKYWELSKKLWLLRLFIFFFLDFITDRHTQFQWRLSSNGPFLLRVFYRSYLYTE
jgi:hypothetical protein